MTLLEAIVVLVDFDGVVVHIIVVVDIIVVVVNVVFNVVVVALFAVTDHIEVNKCSSEAPEGQS